MSTRSIHDIMKDTTRHIHGKVYITYTDPLFDGETRISSDTYAYNSQPNQLFDGHVNAGLNLFNLYENDLTGAYKVSDVYSQVGWVSRDLSGSDGVFETAQTVDIHFAPRPIFNLSIFFDNTKNAIVEDFTVTFTHEDDTTLVKTFVGNTSVEVNVLDETLANVKLVTISVTKIAREGYPAVIIDIPVQSTVLYAGYDDHSELMSIDLLEELTYEDEVEALGGVSANEVTVVLDNSSKDFYFNSDSVVSKQLKRHRKIEPYLGVDQSDGEIEWFPLGVFWSYRWNVPVNGLTATVVGFDTISLLDNTSFLEHHVQVNKSLGELIEYVIEDAQKTLGFLTLDIDESLYDVIIPYAWFEAKSHAAALRRISLCYPMHIYCNRQGHICAKPQRLHLDYYLDSWSDSTNVINKEYSSLYTALPNIINVTALDPVVTSMQLASDTTPFNVSGTTVRTLNFSKPYVSDIVVDIVKDSSVTVTYEAYSWGLRMTLSGTGVVASVICTGNALDTSNSLTISRRDEASIWSNGSVTRDISSDFIQTVEHAETLIDRIFELSESDKYDVSVQYRGDIALTINDPILLVDGIAPDNRYNIKRHQLFWNGALTGTADLNT